MATIPEIRVAALDLCGHKPAGGDAVIVHEFNLAVEANVGHWSLAPDEAQAIDLGGDRQHSGALLPQIGRQLRRHRMGR
ncbi:MAG TPA: hypothetical protein VGX50_02590 [Longimicrobium sp.]|nr:hypothetical protein [Longimicrobium sp.]